MLESLAELNLKRNTLLKDIELQNDRISRLNTEKSQNAIAMTAKSEEILRIRGEIEQMEKEMLELAEDSQKWEGELTHFRDTLETLVKEKAELDFAELEERQKEILHAASSYVKPGGSLVYSTCTINPAENEKQIEAFLAGHEDFAEKKRIQLLPGRETDGFFICRLERAQKE